MQPCATAPFPYMIPNQPKAYPQAHMNNTDPKLVLASTSSIRAKLLQSAGLSPTIIAPRVDEDSMIQALLAEQAHPRDIADTLAEAKARKVSAQHPQALVLGCDQTLDLGGKLLQKPESPSMAISHLTQLQGQTHHLYSAAVLYDQGQPVWRFVGHARMTMRPFANDAINSYVNKNWVSIQQAVGCYKIEEIGVQLFSQIEGDTFTIQGIPLIQLVNYLMLRGFITL